MQHKAKVIIIIMLFLLYYIVKYFFCIHSISVAYLLSRSEHLDQSSKNNTCWLQQLTNYHKLVKHFSFCALMSVDRHYDFHMLSCDVYKTTAMNLLVKTKAFQNSTPLTYKLDCKLHGRFPKIILLRHKLFATWFYFLGILWHCCYYWLSPSVRVDGNETFLCWTVTQIVAALSLQIALKVQNL